MRALGISTILSSLPFALIAQGATPTAFVTTIGKDTFCLEQYTRTKNVISGTWTVLHVPGVYVHDYRIMLGDDGVPVRYSMKYSTPGAATPPDLDSLTVDYGPDSATSRFYTQRSVDTRRFAMREAFPLLGQSYVGVELALMRMRRMHLDSSTITLQPPSEPARPVMLAPARFLSGDSALVSQNLRIHVGADGTILGLRSGALELRRVAPFDIAALTDGFVKAFAPRAAALAAAAAARVEISLPASQLDRFVGEYVLGPTTIPITRDGDHLLLHLPQQPAIQLMAMSPTEFFVRKPDLVMSFESDSSGRVTGLSIGQGDTRQRLTRKD